jgi:methyl-accepting chemotaxis protein
MEIICEGCGKKYQIDPKKITGEASTFQCTECNQKITVLNPTPKPGERIEASEPSIPVPRKRLVGLRGKMLFLYFVIPICLIILGSLYYVNHMKTLSVLISGESRDLVTKMAEEAVAEKARAVARQVGIYLKTHPNLQKEDFHKDPEFMKVAIQSVGNTGYTIVVSRPTDNQPSMIWAHPNKELIGVDILISSDESLGVEFERWKKVTAKDFELGKYYLGVDNRERYEFSVPIEGTIFNAVSTTYLDEFTLPMVELENIAGMMTTRATRNVVIILVVTALLVAILVVVYSYRLSGRLKYLSDVADRISVGDLDVEIKSVKSTDEIGELTHALSRMQTSIRLAIKRLRERR